MEFRLLGPVEALVDGEPIDIGRRRERLLLSVLLLDAGHPVPIQRLAELLWSDGRNPRDAAYVCASRLRGQLRAAGVELANTSAGYAVQVEPDTVDAHRFTRLVDRARNTADPAARAELLRQALDLWRGPALADVATEELRERLCAGLEEQRLAALESRVETDLELGRHHELIAELADLTAAHPDRERLTAARMLALYRADRQADALRAYQHAAAALAEDTGLDPGSHLVELHGSILRNDPALALSAPTPAGPAQLPADLATFTGRVAEVDAMVALARGDADQPGTVVISAIDGMAGVGKSALAVHAAHRLAADFPDGQLFVDLHGHTPGMPPEDPADALDHMLRSMCTPGEQIPHTVEQRAALLRTTLHDRRVLVVLDNALDETQVRPLLPGTPGCLVLVTSRRRLADLEDARPISLDLLSPGDAVELFCRAAGPHRLDGQPAELVDEIVALCGRLPLAIRIAAARLRHRPAWALADLAERLRDQQHRLAELQSGPRSVTAAIDLSYAQLDPEQQRMFRLLGLHPGPDIDVFAAAALADLTAHRAARLLDDLLDVHLLLQRRPNRYRFHDLVGTHAAETCDRLEPAAARHDAVTRLFDHYAHTASTAMDVLYPHEAANRPRGATRPTPAPTLADRASAVAWLDAELVNLFAVAYSGQPAHTLHLSETLHRHLRTRSRYTDAEGLHDHARLVARQAGDRCGEQNALNRLGHIHRMRERYAAATDCFEQALLIARAIGDRGGEHHALFGLGQIYRLQGRYESAIERYQEALAIARAVGNQAGVLTPLVALAHAHRVQGQDALATDCIEQALVIARAIGDRAGEGNVLDAMGDLERAKGRYALAADCYRQSLAIARDLGHRVGELGALWAIGHAYRLQGRYAEAADCYRQVADSAREIGHRNSEFEASYGLGQLHVATGRPDQALEHHDRAIAIAREIGQLPDEVRAHAGKADAHRALGQLDEARQHWQRSTAILADLGLTGIDEVDLDELRARLAETDLGLERTTLS
jgi:tetratricopeptide (TPR) repeat protein/DNA-binding SARP family transcriptional activator